jgi:hypothetical protein
MATYKYRVRKIEVIEESNIEADSRDEALSRIYEAVEEWYPDTDAHFTVEWLDGEED